MLTFNVNSIMYIWRSNDFTGLLEHNAAIFFITCYPETLPPETLPFQVLKEFTYLQFHHSRSRNYIGAPKKIHDILRYYWWSDHGITGDSFVGKICTRFWYVVPYVLYIFAHPLAIISCTPIVLHTILSHFLGSRQMTITRLYLSTFITRFLPFHRHARWWTTTNCPPLVPFQLHEIMR
jgi:hypothetical protein